jgi:hypothetical protein
MTDKIPMQSIHLRIACSRHDLCGIEAVVDDWKVANAKLREWAPLDDKIQQIDYEVVFADGFKHDGSIQIGGGTGGQNSALNRKMADGLLWMMALKKGSFLDRTGEQAARAVEVGHFYDYGVDTSEPRRPIADLLDPFLEGPNAGKDAGLTVVGREDAMALVFEDGDHVVVETSDDAAYLLRTWRIANGLHPTLGEDHVAEEVEDVRHVLGSGDLRM